MATDAEIKKRPVKQPVVVVQEKTTVQRPTVAKGGLFSSGILRFVGLTLLGALAYMAMTGTLFNPFGAKEVLRGKRAYLMKEKLYYNTTLSPRTTATSPTLAKRQYNPPATNVAYTPYPICPASDKTTTGFFYLAGANVDSFAAAKTACNKAGLTLADVTSKNLKQANTALLTCGGKNSVAWVNSWDGNDYGGNSQLTLTAGTTTGAVTVQPDKRLKPLCQGHATLLDFEDVPGNNQPIPEFGYYIAGQSYHGVTLTIPGTDASETVLVIDPRVGSFWSSEYPQLINAVVSPTKLAAVNYFGEPLQVAFTTPSYVTGAFLAYSPAGISFGGKKVDGVTVTAVGTYQGNPVATKTISADLKATWMNLEFPIVDTVTFYISPPNGERVTILIDNLVFFPGA